MSAIRTALPEVKAVTDGDRVLAKTLPSGLKLAFCRGRDVPMLVANDFAHIGLTGYDAVVEWAVAAGERLDVRSLAPTRASQVCLVTAPGRVETRRLYSEYPRLTRCWANATLAYRTAEIVHVNGSAEGLVALDSRSSGVVLVTSGETLRANALVVEHPILATDLCVVMRSDHASRSIGDLDLDGLPRLAMPQFAAHEMR